ncbi:60S acidic ribosomal [Babesia ovis]|uniref:60S acidic ribosomal n=1 Tax=Babesia ovis TaxID=5869 RepID=A0A9W5WU11_BABOV|nr:60S acidic ribosomal [Babesia ovis]
MNVRGISHLWAFVNLQVPQSNNRHCLRPIPALRNPGIHLPKAPAGFWSPKDPRNDGHTPSPKGPPLVHIPDYGPQGVVSYAGIFKEFDNLPKRTLDNLDINDLIPTGVLSVIGRMLDTVEVESLSRLQIALFDELAFGNDVLFHSETSTGKTFSMLLYATLRHYYGIPPSMLCSRKIQDLIDTAANVRDNIATTFTPPSSSVLTRVMILCPTKELAVQSANQLLLFTGGDKEAIRLIIDDQAMLAEDIGPRHVFIVGSANQVNQYLLTKSRRYIRGILQHVGMIILDEIDRLVKVANQYASQRKKAFHRYHPTSAFQICQTLLSLSPNRLQVVGASASISRQHIRYIDAAVQSYRKTKCPLAIIRNQGDRTTSNRYVSVPDSVEHYFAISNTETLGNKVGKLATILRERPNERVLFFVNGSHSLLSFTHYLQRCGFECKVLHHEFGIRDNISKRFSDDVTKGLYDRRESTEVMEMYHNCRTELETDSDTGCMYAASMDSARGLHFSALDTVYMIGVPRNIDEYIHISGRVGRCGRPGRCIMIDNVNNISGISTYYGSIFPTEFLKMSSVPMSQLSADQRDELLCIYSSLILYDEGLEINAENINKLIKSVNMTVQPFRPMLFATALKGKNIADLFAGVGSAAAAPVAAAAGGAAAGGEAKAESKKAAAEPEEEEDDMGFSLFD